MNDSLINSAINNFRNILVVGIDSLRASYELYKQEADSRENDYAVSFEDYFYDWAQCQWELLVERVICTHVERISTYGPGSDYNPNQHSHVFFEGAMETHEIVCLPVENREAVDVLSGEVVDLKKFQFMEFVSRDGDWFCINSPFDHVQLDEAETVEGDYRQVVLPLESIKFGVNKIET